MDEGVTMAAMVASLSCIESLELKNSAPPATSLAGKQRITITTSLFSTAPPVSNGHMTIRQRLMTPRRKKDTMNAARGCRMNGKDGEVIGFFNDFPCACQMGQREERCIGIQELERCTAHATYCFICFYLLLKLL